MDLPVLARRSAVRHPQMPDPITTTSADTWSGMSAFLIRLPAPAAVRAVTVARRVETISNDDVHQARLKRDAARRRPLADNSLVPGGHDPARQVSKRRAFGIQRL